MEKENLLSQTKLIKCGFIWFFFNLKSLSLWENVHFPGEEEELSYETIFMNHLVWIVWDCICEFIMYVIHLSINAGFMLRH